MHRIGAGLRAQRGSARLLTTQRSAMAGPRQEVWSVAGRKTEVLHLPSNGVADPPLAQLLIIPGNPGKAQYYIPFMESLHALLPGASVTAVSHLGMDGDGLTPSAEVYTLEEQIEHKVALLREHLLGPGRPPVVVLAHSIGTYMAIHAVHKLEQAEQQAAAGPVASGSAAAAAWSGRGGDDAERSSSSSGGSSSGGGGSEAGPSGEPLEGGVVKIVGLFPFLTVNPTCERQARIRQMTQLYRPMGHLAVLVRSLPLRVQRWLLARFASDLEGHAAEATLALLNPTNVRSSLFMAICEFDTLAAPADWWLLRQLGRRFACFVCPDDIWFPDWKYRQMLEEVPGVEAYFEESQCHAFCVSEANSRSLAEKIAPLVRSAAAGALQRNGAAAAVVAPALHSRM